MTWLIFTPQKSHRKLSTGEWYFFLLFLKLCSRIVFCLDVHNEAVKSMRYPPDSYKKELEKEEKKEEKKDEEKAIEDIVKEMEEDMDEF